MALTPEQIERVREIIGYTSYDATAALCSRLNAVQETETIADIAEWAKVRNKFTLIKGDGVDIDKARNRLGIINRVRTRLGLSGVESEAELNSTSGGSYCYSHPACPSELNCD